MKFKNNNSFFNTNTKEDLEKAKELIKNNDLLFTLTTNFKKCAH